MTQAEKDRVRELCEVYGIKARALLFETRAMVTRTVEPRDLLSALSFWEWAENQQREETPKQ